MQYEITYPEGLDEYDWAEIEAKGWLAVVLTWPGGRRTLSLYDPVRLSQTIEDEVRRLGYTVMSTLVVLPAVTRAEIERVVARMAEEEFSGVRRYEILED